MRLSNRIATGCRWNFLDEVHATAVDGDRFYADRGADGAGFESLQLSAKALEREKILAKLGPELTADLYVNSSWRDRPPTEMRRMDESSSMARIATMMTTTKRSSRMGGSSRITDAEPFACCLTY
jgi:hypothetical protein